MLHDLIPDDWRQVLADEIRKPYFTELEAFLEEEWKTQQIFPPQDCIFAALEHTPYDKVRVFLVGQDPYHDDGQAHGLCFSVKPGIKLPPSLRNIYKELESDLGIPPAESGYLINWADQGILMLNAVLTVRAHQANSHKKRGWETFTDAVIKAVSDKDEPVIFVLWGGPAQKKRALIDEAKHRIVQSAHPSPLSAYRGFFGSKPFSQINTMLEELGTPQINWRVSESGPPPDDLFQPELAL